MGVRGFNVQFEIEQGSSEFSKIYWVVTDANIAMSVEDILAGRNATQPECIGEYTPTDVEIQTIEVACPMEANSEYIFWVAINLKNGEGARHIVDTGFPIFVQSNFSIKQHIARNTLLTLHIENLNLKELTET